MLAAIQWPSQKDPVTAAALILMRPRKRSRLECSKHPAAAKHRVGNCAGETAASGTIQARASSRQPASERLLVASMAG